MTRKEKIQLLQSVANGKDIKELFAENQIFLPMVIDTDGNDIYTGRPPAPERIEFYKTRGLPVIYFADEYTPDWHEIYGFRKRRQYTPDEIKTAIKILTDGND